MRIAHVAPSTGNSASGVITVLEQLTAAIARRGHRVEVWYDRRCAGRQFGAMLRRLDGAGIGCVPLNLRRRRTGILPTVALPSRDTVDVLHLHSVFIPAHTAIARSWAGPLVLSPHGGYDPVSLRRSLLRKKVYSAWYEKAMVRRSAVTVALTDVEAAHVSAYAGDVVTAVIPNGVAPTPDTHGGLAFRSRLGVPADAPLALYVGRLDVRHKGLDRLIAATAEAPSWQIALVGPDHRNGQEQLRRMAQDLGTAQRVHLPGTCHGAALLDAYLAADLFVLPSRWEGLPMSLLEALAHGVPALVTPEVDRLVPVSSRGAGRVAAPHELGHALEALATVTDGERSARTAAARALAADYDWDRVAAAYEDVYRAAIQRWATQNGASRGAFQQ